VYCESPARLHSSSLSSCFSERNRGDAIEQNGFGQEKEKRSTGPGHNPESYRK
jgi:hypothetical protein